MVISPARFQALNMPDKYHPYHHADSRGTLPLNLCGNSSRCPAMQVCSSFFSTPFEIILRISTGLFLMRFSPP
jgi:hypothetical protein